MFGFPKGKSLGDNGVAYKFLQETWDFFGEGCVTMVQEFWKDDRLSPNSINRVVKMVPKKSDLLEFLENWCNLIMLTTTYKIISKILVEHIKPKVPNLVGLQQTGFLKDRCIIDNLIALKLAQEHATLI